MTPYAHTEDWTLYQGHVLDALRALPDESVHCVVTSPPYWGLRDYGLPPVVWGGDPDCEHHWREGRHPGKSGGSTGEERQTKVTDNFQRFGPTPWAVCEACGAWRGQLGLEPTPDMYVAHLVEVFREVKRVLRRDGTLWLNLGDSYNGSGGAGGDYNPGGLRDGQPRYPGRRVLGLKPKDLVGIPWAVAFALRADGWWLRSEIIWAKRAPMPESTKDRPTRAHEHVFLLSRSARYYYDAEVVKTPVGEWIQRDGRYGPGRPGRDRTNEPYINQAGLDRHRGFTETNYTGANLRDVWILAPDPFPEAHFAVFPEELPRRCILAACPPGGVVLDPFAGSGTTLKVAVELGRKAIGIELSDSYCAMIRRRMAKAQPPLLAPDWEAVRA